MMNTDLIHIIEALIFSSDRPLSVKQMKDIINEEKESTGVTADIKHIEDVIAKLKEKYNNDGYSFMLIEIAGGYRFATKRPYSTWLTKLNKEKLRRRLSQSALETLAIIAYNQPITKSEMEFIRGVNVDYIVGALLEKNLVTITGRAEAPGRPMLYGTTPEFLELLGINSLADLPPLKEIQEIIKSGPPEGITQSDIDFYEEINLIKAKANSEVFSETEKNILEGKEQSNEETQSVPESISEDLPPESTDDKDEISANMEQEAPFSSSDEPSEELLPENDDEERIE
jgi:segregation and condensation protein B